MKRSTKWFLPLVVLAMVLFLAPMQAGAAQTQEPVGMEMPFRVNPLYADVVDEAELETEFDLTAVPMPMEAPVYLTEEEAVESLRQNLVARNETFTVYLDSDTDDIAALSEELFDAAMEHTGEPAQGDYLLWQYAGCGGRVSYTPGTTKYTLIYQVTYYTTAAQEAEMDTAVASVLTELSLDGKSDYEKIKAIYDYICANVEYDYDHLNDSSYTLKCTAYAALINKTAVCQGYAGLLYRLALEAGVDCRMITGTGNGGGHAWNIVKLDGKYYNVDTTWDAGETEYTYFLRCGDNFDDHTRNSAYDTGAFHTAYPMAEADYVPKTYIASGTCGENAAWTLDDEGTLTISGQGAMADYSLAGAPWYSYSSSDIRQIVVEEGITKIGDSAFCGCTGLTGVTLPDSLTATAQTPAATNNQADQNYKQASATVKSYLYENGDGTFARVEYAGDYVSVETYDGDFNFLSRIGLDMELPIFGGFYSGCEDYNFLVFGQNNTAESGSTEVVRVVCYTKDWQCAGSASLYGANTTYPFSAGSLRFAHCGDMLYVRTCHKMYTNALDGLIHQANMTFSVRISDMTMTDGLVGVSNKDYGYVSHSFNQFIQVDGTDLLAVDHGDAYPRSVILTKYKKPAGQDSFTGSCTYVQVLPFTGATGNNSTGASVGGFEISGTHYLVAGNSIVQDGTVSLTVGQRNIFITATDKSDFTSAGTQIYWLTSYADGSGVSVSTPQLVKISGEKLCILWTEGTTLRYAFLDGSGKLIGQIYSAEGALSDCEPIVADGKICWYVTTGSVPFFYTIDLSQPETVSKVHGHCYTYSITVTPTEEADGKLEGKCAYCEEKDEVTLPAISEADYTREVVTAAGCTTTGSAHYTWKDTSCGTVTFDVTLPVLGHSYSVEVTDPSCTAGGYTTYTCTTCGDTYTDGKTSSLGHSYEAVVTAPTCTKGGYTTHTCGDCGDTYIDSETPALGHSYGDWVTVQESTCTETGLAMRKCIRGDAYQKQILEPIAHSYSTVITAPTCAEGGYTTHTCGGCGDTYIDSETPAKGHSYGNWIVDKAATTTEEGEEHRVCGTCGDIQTRKIPSIVHSYDSVVTAPTCTGRGYTTHTCSHCGDVYIDSYVNALGHNYSSVVTAPTCTAGGYTTHTCGTCGDTYTDAKTSALGHSYTSKVTLPTCTAGGYTTYTCGSCGDTYTGSETAALGHKYEETVVKPTYSAAGSITNRCSVCGDTKVEALSQLPNPFADVKEENFFYTPVLWALDNEITNGMDDTHFGPKGDCTRGQVVTFLWRAAGSPEPTSADNPFADVSEGRFYYTAVLWAVENGITNGTGDTTFSPNESCTRGQVVTFLWRFRGEPAPSSGTTAFTDVTPNQFCAKAVAWAVENGITNGINATTFGPKDVCTRSQVVTFLYRAVN